MHDLWLWGLAVSTAALFAADVPAYFDVWSRWGYTHGYVVAAAAVWLVWRERAVFREPSAAWPLMLIPAAGISLVWMLASVTHVRVVVLLVLPMLLLLWSGAALGPRVAERLSPAAALFLLAVPFWNSLTRPLQVITTVVSGRALRLFGIHADIQGNVVHMPNGSFVIEGGCAGLNYLLAGLTIGAIYAFATVRRWPARIAVIGFAGAMSIVSNWTRVATLMAIGHVSHMESIFVSGRPHRLYGWVVFALYLVIFFAVAPRVERRVGRGTSSEAGPPDSGHVSVPTRRRAAPGIAALAAASLAVAAGPILYYSIRLLPTHEVEPFAAAAHSTTWVEPEGDVFRPYAWEPAFEGADEHVQSAWSDGFSSVFLDRLTYDHQAQGRELIGDRSRIAPAGDVVAHRMFGPVGTKRRFVNEAIVRDGDSYLLVWYWYRVAGVETSDALRAKLLEVWAFVSRSTSSDLIAFSAPCGTDSCQGAFNSLSGFFGAT